MSLRQDEDLTTLHQDGETPYELVIGLEVHVELKTESKVFCPCATTFGAPPNSQVCPVCLGLPGAVPVLNEGAVNQAIKAALALNCRIAPRLTFDRKNYFYPDLPKGYQISQYGLPVGSGGSITIEGPDGPKVIRINRAHLEEDTGKSIHDAVAGGSLLDFNRAGVPLLEIVSEPDIRSPEEAREYLTNLRDILAYAGVSDVRMEEGSLRVDTNVSVRPRGSDSMNPPTEVKNLNSFRSVVRALQYEGRRQWELLQRGEALTRETRHWDENAQVTVPSRAKDEAEGYRYLPEPDMPPYIISRERLEALKAQLPEPPQARRRRYMEELGLSAYDAGVLTAEKALADYFEECARLLGDAKTVANWVSTEILAYLGANNLTVDQLAVGPKELAHLLTMVKEGTLSGTMAKEVLADMLASGRTAEEVVEAKGLRQISDEGELAAIIRQVVEENPGPVADYKAGKEKALGALVGQVMRLTRGQANPQLANRLLREHLNS